MKQRKKWVKLNNDGMSLVELIVSLLILVVIFAPCMMVFTTSLKANTAAKKEMYAQTIADNILEEIKFYGVDDLLTADSGYKYITIPTGDPEYKTNVIGFKVGNPVTTPAPITPDPLAIPLVTEHVTEGGEKYKVRVEVTPAFSTYYRFGDTNELIKRSSILLRPTDADDFKPSHATGRTLNLTVAFNDVTKDFDISYTYQFDAEMDTSLPTPMPYSVPDKMATVSADAVPKAGGGYEDECIYLFYDPWGDVSMPLDPAKERIVINGTNLSGKTVKVYIVIQTSENKSLSGTISLINNSPEITTFIPPGVSDSISSGNLTARENNTRDYKRVYAVSVLVYDTEGRKLAETAATVERVKANEE